MTYSVWWLKDDGGKFRTTRCETEESARANIEKLAKEFKAQGALRALIIRDADGTLVAEIPL